MNRFLTINGSVIDLVDGVTFTKAIAFNGNGGSPVNLNGTGNTTIGVVDFKEVTTGTGAALWVQSSLTAD